MIGILMSRMTRSGRTSSASRTAVSPSPASPATSYPSSTSISRQVEPDQRLVLGDEYPSARRARLLLGHLP